MPSGNPVLLSFATAMVIGASLSGLALLSDRIRGKPVSYRGAAVHGAAGVGGIVGVEGITALPAHLEMPVLATAIVLVITGLVVARRFKREYESPPPLPRALRPPLPSERPEMSPEANRVG